METAASARRSDRCTARRLCSAPKLSTTALITSPRRGADADRLRSARTRVHPRFHDGSLMAACKMWGTGVAAVTLRELCFDLHRRLGRYDRHAGGRTRRFGSAHSLRCGASARSRDCACARHSMEEAASVTVGDRIGHGGPRKYHRSGRRQERLGLIPSAQPVRQLCMPAQGILAEGIAYDPIHLHHILPCASDRLNAKHRGRCARHGTAPAAVTAKRTCRAGQVARAQSCARPLARASLIRAARKQPSQVCMEGRCYVRA